MKIYFFKTSITCSNNRLILKVVVEGKFNGSEQVYIPKNFVPIYTAMFEYFCYSELHTENKNLYKKGNQYIFEIFYKI